MNNKVSDYEVGSGNVFQDLGIPDAETEHLKAQLALKIFKIIKKRKWTQIQAAEWLGVDQPEISKLKNGQYSRFSVDRLFYFLNRFHYNVGIKLTKAPEDSPAHQKVM